MAQVANTRKKIPRALLTSLSNPMNQPEKAAISVLTPGSHATITSPWFSVCIIVTPTLQIKNHPPFSNTTLAISQCCICCVYFKLSLCNSIKVVSHHEFRIQSLHRNRNRKQRGSILNTHNLAVNKAIQVVPIW